MQHYTESGLKLLGLDLASLATQGICAGAQPNAYTGYGIISLLPDLGLMPHESRAQDVQNGINGLSFVNGFSTGLFWRRQEFFEQSPLNVGQICVIM